jgi:putative ABC transport system permease protein
MNFLRQFIALLAMSLAGVPQRLGSVLTIIIGVACAVGVLVSMLAMGTGARNQEQANVRADGVVLSSVGSQPFSSAVPREEAAVIRDTPGIRRGSDGEPIVAFESFVGMEGRRRVTGTRVFFPLVGISESVLQYRPEMHFTSGRMFQRGLRELIASNTCVRQFSGFAIGERRSLPGGDWTIVGHFDQGVGEQCTVYADVDVVMSTFARNAYSLVAVLLRSPSDYDAFRAAVQANPTLHLEAKHEKEVVQDAFKQLNGLLDFVSYFVGTIMAIGATLGAVNSLYSIVDARRRELATLRAIGFGSGAIVASILCESVLLALPGALLGAGLAWALFNGLSVSPFGYSFQLEVTRSLALTGVVWALAMGLFGGLLPALRAARVPVTTALRAT